MPDISRDVQSKVERLRKHDSILDFGPSFLREFNRWRSLRGRVLCTTVDGIKGLFDGGRQIRGNGPHCISNDVLRDGASNLASPTSHNTLNSIDGASMDSDRNRGCCCSWKNGVLAPILTKSPVSADTTISNQSPGNPSFRAPC